MEILQTLPENFPFFTVICGMLSAVVCIFLKGTGAKVLTLCNQGLTVTLNLTALLYMILTHTDRVVYKLGPINASSGAVNQLRFSSFECLLALTFSLVIFLSILGGYRYVKQDIDEKKRNFYYILINLLGTAMMALVYTNDLFTGYVFLEILTLSSCGILMIRELGRTTVAAIRYMIMNLLGSGLFLLGVVVLYGITGNLLMENIHQVIAGGSTPVSESGLLSATALISAGLAIKSGMFPFHFWMPDTYGCATPTSASILSGVVSKGYIILLMKVLIRVIGLGTDAVTKVGYLFIIMGVCGMVFGSVSAIRQNVLNKMLALSSAAQIGYIYAGIGIGCVFGSGKGEIFGFAAAIIHILTHALTKPLLFLTSARLMEVSENSGRFKKLRASAIRSKLAGAGFTVGALSMVGVPFFAGFVSKVLFGMSVIKGENTVLLVTILSALAVSTLLNTLYFLRTVITIYHADGEEQTSDDKTAEDVTEDREKTGEQKVFRTKNEKSLLFAVTVFSVLNVALGCGAGSVIGLIVNTFENNLFG